MLIMKANLVFFSLVFGELYLPPSSFRLEFLNNTLRFCIHKIRSVLIREMESSWSYELKSSFCNPYWVGCYDHHCDFESVPRMRKLVLVGQLGWCEILPVL